MKLADKAGPNTFLSSPAPFASNILAQVTKSVAGTELTFTSGYDQASGHLYDSGQGTSITH